MLSNSPINCITISPATVFERSFSTHKLLFVFNTIIPRKLTLKCSTTIQLQILEPIIFLLGSCKLNKHYGDMQESVLIWW